MSGYVNIHSVVQAVASQTGASSWDEFKQAMDSVAIANAGKAIRQNVRGFSSQTEHIAFTQGNWPLVKDYLYKAVDGVQGEDRSLAKYLYEAHRGQWEHLDANLVDIEEALVDRTGRVWESVADVAAEHVLDAAAAAVRAGEVQGRDVCRAMGWPLIEYGVDLAKIDEFTQAYLVCALWSSHETDDEGEVLGNLDDKYDIDDIAPASLATMVEECTRFQEENAELLSQVGTSEQHGHDFWLTRNGHGAGFWDRGYPKEIGSALTKAAKGYGECDLEAYEGKVHRMDEGSAVATLEFERSAQAGFEPEDEQSAGRSL